MSLVDTIERVLRENRGSTFAVRKPGDDLYRIYRYVSGMQTEVVAIVTHAGSFMTYMALTDGEDGDEVRADVASEMSSKLGRTVVIKPMANHGQGLFVASN